MDHERIWRREVRGDEGLEVGVAVKLGTAQGGGNEARESWADRAGDRDSGEPAARRGGEVGRLQGVVPHEDPDEGGWLEPVAHGAGGESFGEVVAVAGYYDAPLPGDVRAAAERQLRLSIFTDEQLDRYHAGLEAIAEEFSA